MLPFLRKLVPLNSPFRMTYHYIRGIIAYLLSGNPARDMVVIGVTGTKGKTTTTNLIAQGLRAAGMKVAMCSTINMMIGDTMIENTSKMTTPSPFVLWKFIARAKSAGCTHLVIETSSHALYYHRVHGLHYDVAVLTNISHDHLDLHKTMENYVDTKLQLFRNLYKYGIHKGVKKISVVNIDTPESQKFLAKDIATDNLYTVGLSEQAQLCAKNITFSNNSTEFDIKIPSNQFHIKTSLFGEFNIGNILCAIAVFMSQKLEIAQIQEIIAQFPGLPGRLEEIPNTRGAKIFIDYAHTEDSLEKMLKTVKKMEGVERSILVFGATGDRDTQKRPKMGAIANQYADIILLTDDDTYTEDSLSIIRDVTNGIPRKEGATFWIIPSREDAIRTALLILKKGDVLVVAGKGAETVQVTQAGPIAWNDRSVTEGILGEIEMHVLPTVH